MGDRAATVQSIADLVGGRVEGDGAVEIRGLASLETAEAGELTFAADAKHLARLSDSRASAALVAAEATVSAPMPLIRVDHVPAAVARLLAHWAPPADHPPVGVHPSAVIAADAQVSDTAAVGVGVTLGLRARIGAGSVLRARVAVGCDAVVGRDCLLAEGVVIGARCILGNRVIIGPGSVIGWDGFGYYFAQGRHHKIPHIGHVEIGDDVEIGACTCVDRAKFGATRIGEGTKIDNLVQIAHNVQIGRHCIVAAQVGVAGSARLGNGVVLMGHVGVRDNITVGDGVTCAAYAAIAGDVESKQTIAGIPARDAREALRIIQAWPKLPDLLKRVRELESRMGGLESPKDH
ncbi:MAG: UDP-3-O-(3-hydroxymyristoyl)glucosamine N-acyltransferase [Phycisphaerae bacterium]|nr:UDP-3-O-(3-hydroxymyristoyl)glucosamine N-acyltransferase [Phycisphaerae bacterium]